jgi:hypothetical protein
MKKEVPPMKRTTILLPDGLWWRVKERAAKERRNAQDVIAAALEAYLSTAVKKGGKT